MNANRNSITTTRQMTGAQAIVECLLVEGVDILFGYPGGAIMPLYDALYDYEPQIRHILSRHEQGSIHAAQGYARVSDKVGVCLATSGPGATNLITGLADAKIDSTPLVCITGQVASHLLGTDAFQETDVIGITTPVTKWNVQVTKSEDIPGALAKAFYIAQSGRPGPVVVDITKDAQFGSLDFQYQKCRSIRSYKPRPPLDPQKIQEAARLINQAERPYILFGQGVLLGNAKEEFKAFVEKSGIPSAWTILGLSALPTAHPLNVGMLGMHGNYGPNLLTNSCDVLIAVGMRFDDRVTGNVNTYAKQAKVIHFDIDPSEINKIIPAEVAVLGDCKESLAAILPWIEKRQHSAWLQQFRDCDQQEREAVIERTLFPASDQPLTMGEVIRQLGVQSNGLATLITDVGQHQMEAQRYYPFKKWRSNVTSGGLGTMGFALPAAIGAKIARPDEMVVAVIGDGGFQMTIQELGTIFQSKIPVKILVLNNEFLGMVRQWQELFFEKRYASTQMINPDFQTVAQGFGLKAEKVCCRSKLEGAMTRFLENEEAFLLEVCVAKEGNVFPMVPTGACVSEIRLR